MNSKNKKINKTALLTAASFSLLFSLGAEAVPPQYKISITNITKGQTFTPILAATHKPRVSFFSLGEMASNELVAIAEGGNIAPLKEVLDTTHAVGSTATSEGLLGPGETAVIMIDGGYQFKKLSLVAMLLPTNDTFVAIDRITLPRHGKKVIYAEAYDAGSETNNELCTSIPGPLCGGEPGSPNDDGEGFVHISSGVHAIGDLESSEYDWRGSVAKITIKKMW